MTTFYFVATNKAAIELLRREKVTNILVSIAHWRKKFERLPSGVNYIIDSGAYTNSLPTAKNKVSLTDFEDVHKNEMPSFPGHIDYSIMFDDPMSRSGTFKNWLRHKEIGGKFVFVDHLPFFEKQREDLEGVYNAEDRVAISLPDTSVEAAQREGAKGRKMPQEDLFEKIDTTLALAKSMKTKTHLLAVMRPAVHTRFKFDAVDSAVWINGSKYGNCFIYRRTPDGKVRGHWAQYHAPRFKEFLADRFKKMGLNAQEALDRDRFNVRSLKAYERFLSGDKTALGILRKHFEFEPPPEGHIFDFTASEEVFERNETENVTKSKFPVLKMPSPKFNILRLAEGKPTGVLSRKEQKARVGKEQVLVNELNKPGDKPFAFGIVKMGPGKKYAGIGDLTREMPGGIDEFSMREYQAVRGFWFYPFELVKSFDKPLLLKGPVPGRRFGSEVDLETDMVKKTPFVADTIPDELNSFAIMDESVIKTQRPYELRVANAPPEFVLLLPGMSRPWLHVPLETAIEKHAHEEAAAIMGNRRASTGYLAKRCGDLPSGLPYFETIARMKGRLQGKSEIDDVLALSPESLKELEDVQLTRVYNFLNTFFAEFFEESESTSTGAVSREDVVNAYIFVVQELRRRGKSPQPRSVLDSEAKDLDPALFKGETLAPVAPSGEKKGRLIELKEVLEKVRPFRFRQDVASIVGGLVANGSTENDIDILIKGPLDEQTRHVIEFRIGRMLGPELSKRVQFLSEEMGGPFTNHVPLGNLLFEVNEDLSVKEMTKQDDPLLDMPSTPGPKQSIFQVHFRGKSAHGDLRVPIDGHLIGWTLAMQKPGAIKEPIETVGDGKGVIADYTSERGNKFLKPFIAPDGLFATPKSRQPLSWLDVKDEIIEAGGVGATANFPAVFVTLDEPKVEFGRQNPRYHEYFVTGSKIGMNGIINFRQLPGTESRQEIEDEGEEGRVTPKGRAFWKMFQSKTFLPSVLKPRTVERGEMPPEGESWLPRSLEFGVPPEFRYWDSSGKKAKQVRDALVSEHLFTDDTVRLVDGQIRLVKGNVKKQTKTVAYTLSRQGFRGPEQVRSGFSEKFWWLVLDRPSAGGVDAWRLQVDPTSGEERVSALEVRGKQTSGKELLTLSGAQEPGTLFNETKDTPSDVSIVWRGTAQLTDAQDGFFRIKFDDGPLKGTWVLIAEEPGAEMWEFRKPKGSVEQRDKERGQGMGVGNDSVRDGGTDECVCPSCGMTVPHNRGTPCTEITCPKCGILMVGSAIKADVHVEDGVQIWDPDKKTDADRTSLRPIAVFAPMKPRKGAFDVKELRSEWATDELIASGLGVEPKWNGVRAIAQSDGERSMISFEDSKSDRSSVLPNVSKELIALAKEHGAFILDAELVDLDTDGNPLPRRTLSRFTGPVDPQDDSNVRLRVFHSLFLDDKNITAVPYEKMRERLEAWFTKAKPEHIEFTPAKVIREKEKFDEAVLWAGKIPGSEGAMFKTLDSTYTLGRFTSSWAKLKLPRKLRAIVVDKFEKAPSPQQQSPSRTYVYECAVGPLEEKSVDSVKPVVKIEGDSYAVIGKTFATNVQADIGDVIEVQFTEILVDETGDKKSVHWFTPMVADKVASQPSTFNEAIAVAHPHEIKKFVELVLDRPLPIFKADDEERLVYGIVLEPETVDAQNDVYSSEEIRQAAHRFMAEFRHLGFMHEVRLDGRLQILESFVAPTDFTMGDQEVKKGTWLMAIRVLDDGLWKAVKDGKITGFSIGGSAVRNPEYESQAA